MLALPKSHAGIVCAMFLAGFANVAFPQLAYSSTPTLMWTGAKRLNLLCNVAGGPGIDQAASSKQLCEQVERLARRGSPMPVQTILIGDPAMLDGDAVTLLIHASMTSHRKDRLIAFNIRPYRISSDQTSVLFGAVPRVADIPSSGASSAALDAALAAALSETVPWLTRPQGPQPIDVPK